jgi:hypothetical protein
MQGDASFEVAGGHAEQSLVIIVPRAKPELCQSLTHAFGDDANVQVIPDRRLKERRAHSNGHGTERRLADRRLRVDMDSELQTGRWIVARCAEGHIDFLDPKAQAILFLCCSHHVVPCQKCQNTYQLRWIPRADPGVFPCPLCGNDLTPAVAAHAQACRYWAHRGTGAKVPPIMVAAHEASARAATR